MAMKNTITPHPRAMDITGQKFGRLTALRVSGRTSQRTILWECRCECGNITQTIVAKLRNGHTKSCGCISTEIRIARNTTHGRCKTGAYRSWSAMNTRCTNPNQPYWSYYGGRGIKVCERWQSFENFLADMGERPKGTTLDRYPDPNGDYEPGNCRWATRKQQTKNQRPRKLKSHCHNGHPMSGDNLRIDPDGRRCCRACHREGEARRRKASHIQ